MTPSPNRTLRPARTVTPDDARRAAARYGIDVDAAVAATENLATGTTVALAVSGKLASGKDSLAPAVFDALGVTGREHHYFAKPLKDELDTLIDAMRRWCLEHAGDGLTPFARGRLAGRVSEWFAMPVEKAGFFTGGLLTGALADPSLHGRSRTPEVRRALQYLGTDVRRAQDPDYWVKLALNPTVEALANGASVYFTDARFPNEIVGSAAFAATTLRLDITADTQRERLLSRDGLLPDPTALNHESETALDDYRGFDIRIDNNGTFEQGLTATLAALDAHWGTRAAA